MRWLAAALLGLARGAVVAIVALVIVMPPTVLAVLRRLAGLPLVIDPAPAAARLDPAAGRIDVVGPVALPTSTLPHIVALVPDPAARHPDLARTRSGHDFVARRRRCHLHQAGNVDVDVDLRERRQGGRGRE